MYQVDYDIPQKYQIILFKNSGVTPFGKLKTGDSFEESVVLYPGFSPKYEVTTLWKDEKSKEYSETEIRVID